MDRLFGTDGVRGVANAELTAEIAFGLGYASARVLTIESKRNPRFLIGRDTRISCDMLEAAFISGVCSMGADAISAGVVPTPAIAYLTTLYGADAGVVISASHNSFEFNGIKFFDRSGYKLPDAIEDEIEQLLTGGFRAGPGFMPPTGGAIGRHSVKSSAAADYEHHLLATGQIDLKGVRIALDCANGAAYKIAPALFSELGAQVFAINCEPNGLNINKDCGSTHLDQIRAHTVKCGADIGFAFDGDADRVLAIDERGGVIDGDTILAMLAIRMKDCGELPHDTVVATVMSNVGFEIAVRKHGIKTVRTAVGDRYVIEEMRKSGYRLGGENSGHIICRDTNTAGDGVYTALRLCGVLFGGKDSGRGPVSEQANIIKPVPQVLLNAKVSNARKGMYLSDPVIRERCERIEELFCGEGRVLIRPSGTEPLIRVMIESYDRDMIKHEAEGLAVLIEERLG